MTFMAIDPHDPFDSRVTGQFRGGPVDAELVNGDGTAHRGKLHGWAHSFAGVTRCAVWQDEGSPVWRMIPKVPGLIVRAREEEL